MTRPVTLVVNPAARKGATLRMIDPVTDILRAHGWRVDVVVTRSADHASQVAADANVDDLLVTLGGDGAVLVTADGAWFGTPPPTRVRSTVGAGDSSLAGFLLAESTGASPEECLRSGIRYGSAAAALPGTQAPTAADLLPGDVPVRALPPR